jgi:hypothetical protein
MSNLQINATIIELDGNKTHYEVRLEWIPRAGELINLYSSKDDVEDYPPNHHYKVVQVKHSIDHITEKTKAVLRSQEGSHFVNIYVKNYTDPLFNNEQ